MSNRPGIANEHGVDGFGRASSLDDARELHAGGVVLPGEPTEVAAEVEGVYDHGVDIKARSHWAYARKRFLRHRLAMGSLVVLIVILLCGVFADRIAPYSYDQLDLTNIGSPPTLKDHHYFGTDLLGRDYFSRVLFGIRTSARVAFVVAILAVIIGTAIGAVAGYFKGWADNLLMRFTDLVLVLPGLAVLLVAARFLGQGSPNRVAIILALLFWTGLARLVRGTFLSLREKEFVEAAKASGSGDFRIIIRHMLPNSLGPIIVSATLLVAAAILVESALSYLGFGIAPPTPALGQLISEGQQNMLTMWWLVTFPGLTITLIVLCINFIGDGLRDALDPTQRRIRA
jgi:ABC-type dipeptide/oligopeptide/nickel transport system permease subunit